MNKNELISYNDYYFDKYEYTQIGIGPNSLHVDQPANDIEKFFFKSTTCPFCGTILKEVFHGSQSDSIGTDLYMSGEVLECPTCSWWTYKTHFCDSCYSNGSYHAICTDTCQKNLILMIKRFLLMFLNTNFKIIKIYYMTLIRIN